MVSKRLKRRLQKDRADGGRASLVGSNDGGRREQARHFRRGVAHGGVYVAAAAQHRRHRLRGVKQEFLFFFTEYIAGI